MIEMIHQLEQLDTQIFLFFNGFHNGYWDYFMMIYSDRFVWIPFYLSFLFVMFKNFPIKVVLTTLVVISLIIAFCDQTASGLLKPLIGRMRPSNLDNPISPLVHVVQGYRGGRFGFPSSHAANSWSMAFFAMYLVRRSKLTAFLCFWALLTSYSRMYLGVHYFGDIVVGTLIGFIYATIHYYIFQHFLRKYTDGFKPTHHLKYSYVPILTGLLSIWMIICASGIFCHYGVALR
ncbi:MAG TPA: phosphatase PAP2 family protein [Prevotella sp.]|nr:phosphatase PAP2 family protein [uncultured Prevotella sp.]HBF04725.1 phosphatase PAP2 family protein [Candidatus Segatella violae]